MLKSLKIKNIGLIRECEIEFDKGLNVLSGETGAGKSVILDSINFVLGQKADKSMILSGENECSSSCVFDISDCQLAQKALDELEIECDGEIVIKRTFSESGKGSIKLNGESVTSAMLRKVTRHLVDVHGQSDHFALLKESNQLLLIDKLGEDETASLKAEISDCIDEIKAVDQRLNLVGGSEKEREQRLDYLRFAIDEITNANLYELEEEELISKRKKMQNLEKINTALSFAHNCISEENGAIDLAINANRNVSSLHAFSNDYVEISEKIDRSIELLQDASSSIAELLDEEYDQAEADGVERRLEVISALKLKYGNGYEKIMATLNEFKAEYETISQSSLVVEECNAQRQSLLNMLALKYQALTDKRKQIASELTEKIVNVLKELAMPSSVFTVSFRQGDKTELNRDGIDSVEFMFSANAGFEPRPLSKVISGGELSRFMLAVKSVTSSTNDAQTYIFDEIDAGISGITANVVAENFAKIAKNKQIIAISHLAQIVAVSDLSMFIKKSERNGTTGTDVETLTDESKVGEVVRLIGGDENNGFAYEHAKQLIDKFNQFKKNL
ncbi:MAG: DNA repair protein RecN [Christensenellaceae bacterium]